MLHHLYRSFHFPLDDQIFLASNVSFDYDLVPKHGIGDRQVSSE
jgi:hypothetical protein